MTEDTSHQLQELPQVGLEGPGPSALADLFSLQRDLLFAQACMHAYVALASDEEAFQGSGPTPQALWNAGVISYRRAFNSGRALLARGASRYSLKARVLENLSDEQRRSHEDVLEMANKHVAHRVGDLEGAVIAAFLAPAPQERAVLGIGSLGAHFVGPTLEDARNSIDLVTVVLEVLQREIDPRSQALLAHLQEQGDLDDLYGRAVLTGST